MNIARIPEMPRDVFGFYKGFILYHFKNLKDFFCKASQIFDPNGHCKSAATT